DRWNLAVMHVNVVLGLAQTDPGGDAFTQAAHESLTTALSLGNPTAIAEAYWACGFGLAATEPAQARAAFEHAQSYASEVDNRWLLGQVATMLAIMPLHTEPDEAALAQLFDAIEYLHHTGWPTHAWSAMWTAIAVLYNLGRIEVAATVLGGCESSGVGQ